MRYASAIILAASGFASPALAQGAWYVTSFNSSTTTPTDPGNKVYKYTSSGVATGNPLDLPDAEAGASTPNRGGENIARGGNTIYAADYWRREINLFNATVANATTPTGTISLNTAATTSTFYGIDVLPYSSGGNNYLFVTGRNTGSGSQVRVARYNFATQTFDRTISLSNDVWGIERQTFGGVDRLLITEGFQGTSVSNLRAYNFDLTADTTAFTSGVLNLNGTAIPSANRIVAPGEVAVRPDGSFYVVSSVASNADARVTLFNAAGAAQSSATITGFRGFDLQLAPDSSNPNNTALYATASSTSGTGKIVKFTLNQSSGAITGQSNYITGAANGATGSYGVKALYYDSVGFAAVPEPGTLALLGISPLAASFFRRRKPSH